jgi:hypothetical protein
VPEAYFLPLRALRRLLSALHRTTVVTASDVLVASSLVILTAHYINAAVFCSQGAFPSVFVIFMNAASTFYNIARKDKLRSRDWLTPPRQAHNNAPTTAVPSVQPVLAGRGLGQRHRMPLFSGRASVPAMPPPSPPPSPPPVRPSSTAPEYIIRRRDVEKGALLGRGALGEVHRGKYRGVQVALKSLHMLRTDAESVAAIGIALSPAERRHQLEVFQRECDIMQSLAHPNILPFIGVVVDDQRSEPLFLATQLIEAGTLHDLIYAPKHAALRTDGGHLPLETQFTVFDGMFSGLAYLAAKRLIHRDVKPTNILVVVEHGKLAKVLLADFGESKQLTETMSRAAGTAAGAPVYMAPEMAAEEDSKGPKADIFSAGVVLVEVNTGRRPAPGPALRKQGRQRVLVPAEEQRAADLGRVRHAEVLELAKRCIVDEESVRADAAEMCRLVGRRQAAPARTMTTSMRTVAVKTLDGRSVTVPIGLAMTVAELKRLVEKQMKVRVESLLFGGRKLYDGLTADDYNLVNGTILYVVPQSAPVAPASRRQDTPSGVRTVHAYAVSDSLPVANETQPLLLGGGSSHNYGSTPAGGDNTLAREMALHGLTPIEQEQLQGEGITDVAAFRAMDDADFMLSGIDIAKRRQQQLATDRLKQVQDLLRTAPLSPAGRRLLQHVSDLDQLRGMDEKKMSKLGLGAGDRQKLKKFCTTPEVRTMAMSVTEPERLAAETLSAKAAAAALAKATNERQCWCIVAGCVAALVLLVVIIVASIPECDDACQAAKAAAQAKFNEEVLHFFEWVFGIMVVCGAVWLCVVWNDD